MISASDTAVTSNNNEDNSPKNSSRVLELFKSGKFDTFNFAIGDKTDDVIDKLGEPDSIGIDNGKSLYYKNYCIRYNVDKRTVTGVNFCEGIKVYGIELGKSNITDVESLFGKLTPVTTRDFSNLVKMGIVSTNKIDILSYRDQNYQAFFFVEEGIVTFLSYFKVMESSATEDSSSNTQNNMYSNNVTESKQLFKNGRLASKGINIGSNKTEVIQKLGQPEREAYFIGGRYLDYGDILVFYNNFNADRITGFICFEGVNCNGLVPGISTLTDIKLCLGKPEYEGNGRLVEADPDCYTGPNQNCLSYMFENYQVHLYTEDDVLKVVEVMANH